MPDIKIASFEGTEFDAYYVPPSGEVGPGLVIIQEIFGVNASMRKLCDDYAAQGYIAICPDLLWRQQPGVQLTDRTPQELERASALLKGFDIEAGLRDLISTLAHIRKITGGDGKVGLVGYGLGARLAYLLAMRSDVDASVGYYGIDPEKNLSEISDICRPFLMHFAALDKFAPPDKLAKILRSAARNPVITAHVYEGVDHAFARVGGRNYNKEAAELADSRTREFLAKNMQG